MTTPGEYSTVCVNENGLLAGSALSWAIRLLTSDGCSAIAMSWSRIARDGKGILLSLKTVDNSKFILEGLEVVATGVQLTRTANAVRSKRLIRNSSKCSHVSVLARSKSG